MRACLVLALALMAVVPLSARADYLFSVERLDMIVEIQPDASAHVHYEIEFVNTAAGQPIDIVDIGMPTDAYRLDGIQAWLDGAPQTDIRHSAFVVPGVEVHLGSGAIPAGGRGTFEISFTHPDLVYQDTTRKDLASLQITPTWFGDPYVSGTTAIDVVIYTPPGVAPDEVLHQDRAFQTKATDGERVVVGWRWDADRLTGPHRVGLSFPARPMERVVTISRMELLTRYLEQTPLVRWVLGLLAFGLWTFAFFRFSGGTGWTAYVVLGLGIAVVLLAWVPGPVFAVPLFGVLAAGNEVLRQRRKRNYLPPVIEIEGGGIKRGLTAPEAAVILEMPLNKVLTLVLFGLLRKGLVQMVEADPLRLEVRPELTTEGKSGKVARRARSLAASKLGVTLHEYEQGFLWEIERGHGSPVSELDFADELKPLIEHAAERVAGFDLSDTRDYYRRIIHKAVAEAAALGDPEARQQHIDRDLDWIFMDSHYRDAMVVGGWHYHSPWMRSSTVPSGPTGDPGAAGGGGAGAAGGGGAGAGPTLGDVAGSFVGWAENTVGQVASSLSPISLRAEGLASKGGAVLDLSGVDNVTREVLKAMAESSSSGGGGGGRSGGGGGGSSCACACAGCACACACAGGGR